MRAIVLLEVVLFITTGWAGGYQGVLERVLLYYEYEIGGLNPEAERTVGYSYRGEFNSGTGQCPGGPLSSLDRHSLVPFARDSNGNPLLLADGANGLDPELRTKTAGSGTNSATGEAWDVVDWKRKIDDGVTDTGRSREEVTRDVEAPARDFYTNNNGAMNHKPVIDAARRAAQRMNHCGP
ncbi:hypothetical protein S40288_10562 [Stachybotrys chartarum IBT 40288]|nr:hypothetical protein S40288_10562 [Stachybotrys chartarum IBT 40288]